MLISLTSGCLCFSIVSLRLPFSLPAAQYPARIRIPWSPSVSLSLYNQPLLPRSVYTFVDLFRSHVYFQTFVHWSAPTRGLAQLPLLAQLETGWLTAPPWGTASDPPDSPVSQPAADTAAVLIALAGF